MIDLDRLHRKKIAVSGSGRTHDMLIAAIHQVDFSQEPVHIFTTTNAEARRLARRLADLARELGYRVVAGTYQVTIEDVPCTVHSTVSTPPRPRRPEIRFVDHGVFAQ